MIVYEYTARNSTGRKVTGVIEADSSALARQNLRDKGLFPENLTREKTSAGGAQDKLRGLSHRELLLVTRQLASLIQSGLPIEEALRTSAEHASGKRMKMVLSSVRSQLAQGFSLSASMATHSRSFDDLYRAMVAAGEQAGQLGPVLENLADYLEQSHARRQKLQGAMVYPIVLTLVSLAVIGSLMVWVVPKITAQFDRAGQSLPALTEAMISISSFLREYGLMLMLFIIGGLFLWRWLLTQPKIRMARDSYLLKAPLLGNLINSIECARMCRTLGMLLASGVPLLDALTCTRPMVQNRKLGLALEAAASQVRSGDSLGRALAESNVFPPLIIHMIKSGETASELDAMLIRCADQQDREVESTMTIGMNLFEPVLIVAMGGIVLTIVLSILLPILELNQLTGL